MFGVARTKTTREILSSQIEPTIRAIANCERFQYGDTPKTDEWVEAVVAAGLKKILPKIKASHTTINFRNGSEGSSGNTLNFTIEIDFKEKKKTLEVHLCDCGAPNHMWWV